MKAKLTLAVCAFLVFCVGCNQKKTPDTASLKAAINSYYTAHPDCLWPQPVKFPAQADTSNEDQTKGFDALMDAGLLTRKPEEKKRFLIGSKQVNDYDFSDQGRSNWTPDQAEPGYGNFCFGHRDVTSIGNVTTTSSQNGKITSANVSYRYDLTGVPDWAKNGEVQTAFPNVQSALSGQGSATAQLNQTQSGWQFVQ